MDEKNDISKKITLKDVDSIYEKLNAAFAPMARMVASLQFPSIHLPNIHPEIFEIPESPVVIAERNEQARHEDLMKIQKEMLVQQSKILTEQAETTRFTKFILILTVLSVALTLVVIYLAMTRP